MGYGAVHSQDDFNSKKIPVKMHEIDGNWQRENQSTYWPAIYAKKRTSLMNGFSIFARSFAANLQLRIDGKLLAALPTATYTPHLTRDLIAWIIIVLPQL